MSTTVNLTVPFLGIVPVPIKTYTPTYSPISGGWQMAGNSIEAMEFIAYGTTGDAFEGAKAQILTRNHVTPLNIGLTTGGFHGMGAGGWFKDKFAIVSFVKTGISARQPYGTIYSFPLDGVGVTDPSPVLTNLVSSVTDLVIPAPNNGWGGTAATPGIDGGVGIHYSWTNGSINLHGIWDGVNNIKGVASPGFTSGLTYSGGIPAKDGTTRVFVNSSGGTEADKMQLRATLMDQYVTFHSAVFTNPAVTTFDVDAYMHDNTKKSNFRPTLLGFLAIERGTITVNGTTLVGYGILVLPDFQGYYLLQLTGTDTDSNAWTTTPSGGQVFATINNDSDLFMKSANSDTLVFISGSKVLLPHYNSTFAALQDPTHTDWKSVDTVGAVYDSFFSSCQSLDDPDVKTNVPYVYTFMTNDSGADPLTQGATLKIIWDWLEPTDTLRVTPATQVYNFHQDELISVKKTRVRGRGRQLHVYYKSDGQKDFNIKGWVIFYETNAGQ